MSHITIKVYFIVLMCFCCLRRKIPKCGANFRETLNEFPENQCALDWGIYIQLGSVHFFDIFGGRGARKNVLFANLNTVVSISEKL